MTEQPDRAAGIAAAVYAKNIGLAAFLIASCALALSAAAQGDNRIDFALYLLATVVLVVNTARRRAAQDEDNRPWVWLVCAVSSLYILAFEPGETTSMVIVLHILGDMSLIYLGRSFAILPARRVLRVGWLYRYVRHPTYATYIATDLLFITGAHSPRNLAVAALGLVLFLVRIHLEERLLARDPAYVEYQQRTRHRLIPGLY